MFGTLLVADAQHAIECEKNAFDQQLRKFLPEDRRSAAQFNGVVRRLALM
jgi:hypothetical protein